MNPPSSAKEFSSFIGKEDLNGKAIVGALVKLLYVEARKQFLLF